MSILSEAQNIVDGDRQQTYGTPLENHTRTAELWSAYLGTKVTARDVCMMNILQKCSRDRFKPHRDNLVDIAGYAENAQRCEPSLEHPNPRSLLAKALAAQGDFYRPAHDTGREDGRDPPP